MPNDTDALEIYRFLFSLPGWLSCFFRMLKRQELAGSGRYTDKLNRSQRSGVKREAV